MSAAFARVMSRSSSFTVPDVGRTTPEMQFSRVVFPDPFGPISPDTRPFGSSSETPLSARTPPKCFVRPDAQREPEPVWPARRRRRSLVSAAIDTTRPTPRL